MSEAVNVTSGVGWMVTVCVVISVQESADVTSNCIVYIIAVFVVFSGNVIFGVGIQGSTIAVGKIGLEDVDVQFQTTAFWELSIGELVISPQPVSTILKFAIGLVYIIIFCVAVSLHPYVSSIISSML